MGTTNNQAFSAQSESEIPIFSVSIAVAGGRARARVHGAGARAGDAHQMVVMAMHGDGVRVGCCCDRDVVFGYVGVNACAHPVV